MIQQWTIRWTYQLLQIKAGIRVQAQFGILSSILLFFSIQSLTQLCSGYWGTAMKVFGSTQLTFSFDKDSVRIMNCVSWKEVNRARGMR